MDDRDLLLDYVRNGSSRAFTSLVERHINLVYSAALRRVGGDPHRASDVTQQVFTDLARKAGKLISHPVLDGWLHQSTHWAAAGLRRSETRRQQHEEAAAQELAEPALPPAEAPVDWDQVRPLLDAALDELREGERDAVLLRYFEGLSYAEVGRRLGTAENAARMRAERALERLQRILKRKGITSTTAALAVALTQQAVSAAPAGLVAAVAPASLTAAAASGATAAATGMSLLLANLQLALVIAVAAILGVALYREQGRISTQRTALNAATEQQQRQTRELATLKRALAAEVAVQRSLPAAPEGAVVDPILLERQRLDLIVRKGELDWYNAPLFRHLALPAGTLDRLKELMVQRNQAQYDALQVAKAEGVEDLTAAETRQVNAAAAAPIDTQIAMLLTPEQMATFTRYQSTLEIRGWAVPASVSRDPARWDTAEKLVELGEKTGGTAGWLDIDDTGLQRFRTFVEQAKPLLRPDEAATLERSTESAFVWNKLATLARAAALQGKLRLSRNSAKYYPNASAPEARKGVR